MKNTKKTLKKNKFLNPYLGGDDSGGESVTSNPPN